MAKATTVSFFTHVGRIKLVILGWQSTPFGRGLGFGK